MKKLVIIVIFLAAFICVITMNLSTPLEHIDISSTPTFTKEERFISTTNLQIIPKTVEAWIYVPEAYDEPAGTIYGNYYNDEYEFGFFNLQITSNGNPLVSYNNKKDDVFSATFDEVDVRTGEWVHLAIVYDEKNLTLSCHLNGKMIQRVPCIEYTESMNDFRHVVGGDNRYDNTNFFKGKILSLAVYPESKTSKEIRSHMSLSSNIPSAAIYYNFENASDGNEIKNLCGESSNLLKETMWVENKEPVTDYAYSFVFVGDTQNVVRHNPEKLHYIYDWIISNKEEKNIKHVFGLGDITDTSSTEEWKLAKEQISRLNDIVPYSLTRGNHDNAEQFIPSFAYSKYVDQFDGFFQNISNSWRTFCVGETNYLFLTLDFYASLDALAWAEEIISAHPDHKVIITTHYHLTPQLTQLDHAWNLLYSKYENIQMVISGHSTSDHIIMDQRLGENGNVVTQMMINTQYADLRYGGLGNIAIFYFSEDGSHVQVEYYSTIHDKFFMTSNQLEFNTNSLKSSDFTQPNSNGFIIFLSVYKIQIITIGLALITITTSFIVYKKRNRSVK